MNARHRMLAYSLAALAGYVDASRFHRQRRVFRQLHERQHHARGGGFAVRAGGDGHGVEPHRGVCWWHRRGVAAGAAGVAPRETGARASAILWSIAAVLTTACLLFGAGATYPALLLTAAAMGAENTIFEEDGEVTIGLTYMTGTLVKTGQRIAGALAGGPKWDWTPYAALWVSLASGSIAGAFAHHSFGVDALWAAAGVALVLGAWGRRGP